MTIKIEPFLSGKWGWEEGEGDWKDGVDENFLKFSYMINATLDSFGSSLPPSPVDGTAYFLSTDNTLNARVDGEWRKFPIPKGYVVTMKADGSKFEWTGTTFAPTLNRNDKTKLDGVATGATVNASDSSLRDRATHTGAQAISTVTGLQASLDSKLPLTGGAISGGLTVSTSIQSPLLLTYNSVPVHFFKDTDTAGSNIRGSTVYFDMDGVTVGNVGFVAGDGKYEIINTGRPVKITSSTLDVVGDITSASLTTSGDVTASVFNGSGAGLTNLPTTALTGTTTVGRNLLQSTNPSAVTFPRINADNTVTYRSAVNLLADIAAVGVTGTQTISGNKTFSGTNSFTGATTIDSLVSNNFLTVNSTDPHLIIKDSNTSGSTLTGSLDFKDSLGSTKGTIAYNGDGLLRIINSNGGGVGIDTAVRVTGTLPFITLTDTDTSGTIAKGFISFVDSLGATNAALGMIDGDGRFKFFNPSREFYFDGSNVKSLGTLEAVGAIIGASSSIAGTLTAGDLSTVGTVGAAGTITSGTSVSAPTMSGGTSTFGGYSGGAAVLTGTSQLAKLGVATSSLGTDVLAVNGTSAFYGHAVVNGSVTATNLIGAGASITGLTKGQVGLSNVDNTSDANKPISTATQTALDAKVSNTGNESISGLKTFTTGVQTGTINAGNGTSALTIGSTGNITASGSVTATIFNGSGAGLVNLSVAALANITSVGSNFLLTASPSIVSFVRVNADNTITYRTPANLLADIAAVGTSGNQTVAGNKTFSGASVFSGTAQFNSSAVVLNTTPSFVLKDSDTSGVNAAGFISFQDSAGATNAALGFTDANGKFKFSNPTREFYFDASNVKSLGTLESVGSIIGGASATLVGSLTAGGAVTASAFIGSGSGITALNASAITTGTVPYARLGFDYSTAATASNLVQRDASGNITANQIIGNDVLISAASQPQLKLKDSASINFASFYYHVPSSSAVMERSGFKVIDASSSRTWIGDQVGAPVLTGNTTDTKLYRGGTEVFSANSTDVKIGRTTSDLAIASNATETYVNHVGNKLLHGTGTSTQLNRGGSTQPVVLAGTSSNQYFSPAAPVLTATVTTLAINSGNGAPAISIDSTGKTTFLNGTVFPFGTFNPTVYGATTAGAPTSYTYQTFTYQIVGKMLTATGRIQWTGHTGTGAMRIGSMPFSATASASVSVRAASVAVGINKSVFAELSATQSFISIVSVDSTSGFFDVVPIAASGDFVITITYPIA